MQLSSPSCAVALPRERNNATAAENATSDATARVQRTLKPASLQELRTQLRAQLTRNESTSTETANPASMVGADDTATDPMTPADARMEKVIAKLQDDPRLRYAIEVRDDVDHDAVILTLAIRDKAACELRIPKSRYDAFALLELIEKHTTRETLQ